MFEAGGKNVRPHQGALTALSLAGSSLDAFPKCEDGKKIRAAIDQLDRPVTHDQIIAFDAAVKSLRLPTAEQLEARSPVTSLVVRVTWSFIQAILAEEVGDEIRAWRCVATCAIEAGLCMAIAYEHERKRSAGTAKIGSQAPLATALSMLVSKYLSNDKIFAALSDPDATEYDDAFPIDVVEPLVSNWSDSREKFHYVVRGENETKIATVKTLRNSISKLRSKSREAHKPG